MRRLLIFAIIILGVNISQGQILTFDHGKVEFKTTTIMSDIEAVSDEMIASIDQETSVVEIIIPIESFEFEYEMMQEHFNEEYLESDQYPDAIFRGKIDQTLSNISESIDVNVSGELTIHGVSNAIQVDATLSKQESFTKVKFVFPIIFKDYKVEEPSILTKSVAKDVQVKGILYLK